MKRLIVLLVVLVGINRLIEAVSECPCRDECWCKKPVLKNFRWLVPRWHKL